MKQQTPVTAMTRSDTVLTLHQFPIFGNLAVTHRSHCATHGADRQLLAHSVYGCTCQQPVPAAADIVLYAKLQIAVSAILPYMCNLM